MTEANSNSFSRIESARPFFRPELLGATLCAVLASVSLAGLILCSGGIAALISLAARDPGIAATDGLFNALHENSFPDNLVKRVVEKIPVLRNGFALPVLSVACVVLLIVRWLLLAAVSSRTAVYAGQSVGRLRQHIHRQSMRLDPGDLSGESSETTRRLFRHSADTLESAVHLWAGQTLVCASDTATVVITFALVDLRAGLECMIPVLACWILERLERSRQSASADLLTEQVDRSLHQLADGLEKSCIVTSYGMESFEQSRFEENLQSFSQRRKQLRHQLRRGQWISRFILMFCVGVPAYILAWHILGGARVGLPGAVMIAGCMVVLYLRLRDLEIAHSQELEGNVAAEELGEYIKRVPTVSQAVGARFLEPMSRAVQFDQICFETAEHPRLLDNLDLRIDSGQRVALISLRQEETDALVSLLPRLNDPQSGQVLIDGKDITRVTLESLRAEVMIVSGTSNLFNATVLENITCGHEDISRQQAMEAGKLAHAEKFTRQLPKGYETRIGEHGVALSVGEAFRLALARAIVRRPALLIVEEPRVPLDSETKALLDDTYDRICSDRTVIFIPSRLSTVKKCKRIVLLDRGRVVTDGPHDELVRTSELYRHWEYIRFNVFRSPEE